MSALRSGFTTGTCAAAAAKAAAMLLCGRPGPDSVDVALPDGARATLPILRAEQEEEEARAMTRKDAGDDPDVTDGCTVVACVSWASGGDVVFVAGDGVGTVTKPGLSVPPGEAAINPIPRRMIRAAIREVTDRPVRVRLSIPGGKELAAKTFNPRLGIEGGLSILGTTGRVRPWNREALQEALRCALNVAAACGVRAPVVVPGHIGERAARKHFRLVAEQVIEVGNEWGFVLDLLRQYGFASVLALGHPGKLAKLAAGEWDTHSSRSASAVSFVAEAGREALGRPLPESATTEGIFAALGQAERTRLAGLLAGKVREAVADLVGREVKVAVALVNMRGEILGSEGDLSAWQ